MYSCGCHRPRCIRKCVGEIVKKFRVYQNCCYTVVAVCHVCGGEFDHRRFPHCPYCGGGMMHHMGMGHMGMGHMGHMGMGRMMDDDDDMM